MHQLECTACQTGQAMVMTNENKLNSYFGSSLCDSGVVPPCTCRELGNGE